MWTVTYYQMINGRLYIYNYGPWTSQQAAQTAINDLQFPGAGYYITPVYQTLAMSGGRPREPANVQVGQYVVVYVTTDTPPATSGAGIFATEEAARAWIADRPAYIRPNLYALQVRSAAAMAGQ